VVQFMSFVLIVCIIQFGVSVALLALQDSQLRSIVESGWGALTPSAQDRVQQQLNCRGINAVSGDSVRG
jgi:hypothetical protein